MFAITTSQPDTFISGILTIADQLNTTVDPDYIYGTTGHGARFTLAMNAKWGRFIGHPASIYSWDIISVIEHCFPDAGLQVEAYVGRDYANQARSTAAQTSREVPANIHLIPGGGPVREINGHLLIAHPAGRWIPASSTAEIDLEWDHMPFGPVIINFLSIQPHSWTLPRSTMSYLISTLERGEEPMEVVGKDDLNAVSGWKAFARWMQSFTVPLPDIQHPFISQMPELLLDRRIHFTQYLHKLSGHLEGTEEDLVRQLADRYQEVIPHLKTMVTTEPSLDQVRAAYFAEQGTQGIYKKLENYLTYGS